MIFDSIPSGMFLSGLDSKRAGRNPLDLPGFPYWKLGDSSRPKKVRGLIQPQLPFSQTLFIVRKAPHFEEHFWTEQRRGGGDFMGSYPTNLKLKRVIDVIGSAVLLCGSFLIMALIALFIWLDSRGPIFYKQMRVGLDSRKKNERRYVPSRRSGHRILQFGRRRSSERRHSNFYGKPFPILKFRTMSLDAEKNGPMWCQPHDPRVTRVGEFLRKTHLDELPQLLNILKGDMSLVGPRPERPEFVPTLLSEVPGYKHRFVLKPGLTGLAQIRHTADRVIDDVKKKVKYDILYLKRASWTTDLMILFKTIPVALNFSNGAANGMAKRRVRGRRWMGWRHHPAPPVPMGRSK